MSAARPFRHLCPEADQRGAMTEAEFWAHVFGTGPDVDTDAYWFEHEAEEAARHHADLTPCAECGEHGPCAYDPEGRPLVHLVDTDDIEQEQP